MATRPALLAIAALGGLAGVGLQLQQPVLADVRQMLGACAAALLLGGLCWRWPSTRSAGVALVLSAMLLAFASTSLRASWRLQDALDPALEGRDIEVTGVIAEMPRLGLQGPRFVFDTEAATLQGQPVKVPPRLSLGWYRSADDESLLATPPENLRAGQRWRLPLRLRAPHGSLNPDGFDVELWMWEQGLGASGTVRARPEATALQLGEASGYAVQALRQRVRDAIVTRVPDPLAAGVLAALAIGDQAAIDREGWDLFRITGVAHLMSISGLHVTMFAWLAGAAVSRLWRLHPRLPLWLPAPLAAGWGGLAAAAGYALLAGWGVPAQRTVWMLACVVLLRVAGLRWPSHAVLLAAACCVTAIDPWALMQPGTWLSFGAVALLVASEPVRPAREPLPEGRRARLKHAIGAGLRTQLVATVGLTPLSLVFFQQVSLVGLLANLLAIPLVTLLITPLALLGAALPLLWLPAAALVQALAATLQMLAGWPLAQWSAAAAPGWAVVCGLLAALLSVAPLPLRLRLLALPLVLPLLAPAVTRPPDGRFELLAADIGQGTAVLVRTRRHLLLFDTGPQTAPDVDAGSRVLLPLLRARGETRIDLLMLSHRDSDHVGGAAAVLGGMPVLQLSSSLLADHPLVQTAARLGLPHRPCAAGQSWTWDGVHFQVLHPLSTDLALPLKPNALSCVLRVQGAGGSVLLTGDIEAPQEAALLARDAAALRSDVLLVPHHGSRTSSTAAFLAAVAPRVAVVQAGYRSRYGHPAPDVMARYQQAGIAVVRSDRCGAWLLPADGPPRCQRGVGRRYWHHLVEESGLSRP